MYGYFADVLGGFRIQAVGKCRPYLMEMAAQCMSNIRSKWLPFNGTAFFLDLNN